jgi:hypothetical protein
MGLRNVILIGALAASALAAIACSGPPAGSVSFSEGKSESIAGGSRDTGEDPSGASTPAPGGGGSAAASDPVFKGSAFAAQPPTNRAKGQASHSALPAPANATLDPSGLNCMQSGCHQATFSFGGTVYSSATGGTPVAGVEVRVTDKDGNEFAHAFSDQDGNFWIDSKGPFPAVGRVGIRNGTTTKLMSTPLGATGGGCNDTTCHGSPTMRVALN